MENKTYETRDADARRIGLAGALVAVVTIVIMALLLPLYWHFGRRDEARSSSVASAKEPPMPALQVNAQEDLATMKAREDAELRSYGWIDKERGIVRIPIERAIDLLAERGLPARRKTEAGQ